MCPCIQLGLRVFAGIMIAIGIGAVLGVLLGIVFLTTVLVCQKR